MRRPYRPDRSVDLAAIEARRKAASIPQAAFLEAAGITRSVWQDALKTGRVFDRTLRAAERALRGIEQQAAAGATAFPDAEA